jgi:hypothetical protein
MRGAQASLREIQGRNDDEQGRRRQEELVALRSC